MASYDFRFIRPVEITDAVFTSSNVPETVAATYSGATAYVVGDRVGLAPVNGAAQLIYECIQNGTGQALPVPPATSTAFWRYVASVYPVYAGVTYALNDIVSSIGANTHLLYKSLAAGNLNNPLTDTTKWVHYGSPKVTDGTPYNSTNRWKMFDQSYGSQTVNAESIVITLAPGVLINAIAFFNTEAVTIRVQQSVSGYDQTIDLTTHVVGTWYDWFYEELVYDDEALFRDIPAYTNGVLTITISAPNGTAKCGALVVGREMFIGETEWGMIKEIQDYSRAIENDFGELELQRGAYVERLNLDVHLTAGTESEVFRQMKAHRSEPLAFVGSTEFNLSIVYGFIESWQVPCEITGGLMPVRIRGLA